MQTNDLRYPIGQFEAPAEYTAGLLARYISDIELFPKKLKQEVVHLSEKQLYTPYRPGGWTIKP